MFNLCWIVTDAEKTLRERWDFLLNNSRSLPALVVTAVQDLIDNYRIMRHFSQSLAKLNPEPSICMKYISPRLLNDFAKSVRFAIKGTARLYICCHLESDRPHFNSMNKVWSRINSGYIVSLHGFKEDCMVSSLDGLRLRFFSVRGVELRGTYLETSTLELPWSQIPHLVSLMTQELEELECAYSNYLALADDFYSQVGKVSGPTVESPNYYVPS